MDRQEFWEHLQERNPTLRGERMAMSVAEFKRFYELVWDMAHKHGEDNAKGAALFNSLFGNGK